MADSTFGGDFDELARETARLRTLAQQGEKVTQSYVTQVEQSKAEQQAIARRVRTSATRTAAEAETLITRGAQAGKIADPAATTNIAAQRRQMDLLGRSTDNTARMMQRFRQVGPWAWGRSQPGLEALARSMYQLQLMGRNAAPGFDPGRQLQYIAEQRRALGALYQTPGQFAAAQAPGQTAALLPGGVGGIMQQRVALRGLTQDTNQLAASMARIRQIGQSAYIPTAVQSVGGRAQLAGIQNLGAPSAPPNAAAMTAYSAATARAATSQTVLNAQMERHGALSSEFISELARGNASLDQFGRNLVLTAGKFGGWLAAGAGLYAILGLFGQVTSGAIDASSGVNQLQRVIDNVDPRSATAGFRDLSEHFNLPIEEVSAAVYQMGKVFHDQESAMKATESVLYAVKVGELDVATASRYLTAITNGFNLSADKQAIVFDQVNRAQNRYNISIESLLGGTAKAAGVFKAAGGDATHLIALITTLAKTTGLTGQEIGTALQRSPHFIRQNEADLKAFGVDTEGPIQDIYASAIKAAQGMSGEQTQLLAEALFGPQLGAKVGNALLNQGEYYLNKVLPDLSEDKSKGSAEQELQTTLGSIAERIKMIGTLIATLGSNLADSGFLALLGGGVYLLTEMLKLINGIFEIFNLLPGPLRQSLGILLQLYGIYRLMRRFGVGERFQEGSLANQALTDPRRGPQARRLDADLTVRAGQLQDEIVNASAAVTRAELERESAVAAQKASSRRTAGVMGQLVDEANLTAAHGNAVADATVRHQAALQREAVAARALEETQLQQQNLRDSRRRGAPRQPIDIGLPPVTIPQGDIRGGLDSAQLTREMTSVQTRLADSMRAYSATGGALRIGAAQVKESANRARSRLARTNMSGAAASLRVMATNMRGFAADMLRFLGPLDYVLAAVTIVAALAVQSASYGRRMQGYVDQIQSAENLSEVIDAQKSASSSGNLNPLEWAMSGFPSFGDQQTEVEKRSGEAIDSANNLRYQFSRGIPITETLGAYPDVLQELANSIKQNVAQGNLTAAEARAKFDNLQRAAENSPYIDDPIAFVQELEDQALAEQAQATASDITKRLQLSNARSVSPYDAVGQAAAKVREAQASLSAIQAGGDAEDILDAQIALQEAENGYAQAIDDQAKTLLDAKGQLKLSQIDPANTVAIARQTVKNSEQQLDLLRRQGRPGAEIIQAKAALNQAEEQLQGALQERAEALIDVQTRLAVANAPLYAPLVSEMTALQAARRKMATLRRFGGTRQEFLEAQATIDEAERDLALAQNERAQQLQDIAGQIALARINPENTVAVAQQTLSNAQANLSLLQAQGRDAIEIQQAYLDVVQAQVALQQAIEDEAEAIAGARFDLAAARATAAGNEVRAAAIAIRQARYQLEHADTKQEQLEARQALVNARASKRDAIYQTELDDIQYQADIGRLTVQQQIAAYQRLLKTLELNRDMRRDLKVKIAQLRKEAEDASGDFDLRVGNIRLPTIYDIRRAQQGGVNSGPNVAVNNSPTVNVYAYPGSEAGVAEAIDRSLGTGTKAAMRSAGIV